MQGVVPPEQCLETNDGSVRGGCLRLEEHLDHASLDGLGEVTGKGEPAVDRGCLLGCVQLDTGLCPLRRVHGHVGVRQGLLTGRPVTGQGCHADAGAGDQRDVTHVHGLTDDLAQGAGMPHRLVEGRRRQQDGELVTAEPRDHAASILLESRAGHVEQQVSRVVPECVVDVLEVVEVDQAGRRRHLLGLRLPSSNPESSSGLAGPSARHSRLMLALLGKPT